MSARLLLAASFFLATGATAASAEQTSGLDIGRHDSSAPISVSSDNMSADMQTKIVTYTGNVIITQADFKLRADKVNVHIVNGKASVIDGAGNVLFTSTSGNASGDTGVYDLNTKNITLDGKVVLTKEKNVMRGTHLVMNMDTGLASLTAKGMAGGRVQGLFTPPPKGQTKSQTTSKSPPK